MNSARQYRVRVRHVLAWTIAGTIAVLALACRTADAGQPSDATAPPIVTSSPEATAPLTLVSPPRVTQPAPAATLTAVATATASPAAHRRGDLALAHVRHLAVNLGPRTLASPREEAAAQYIAAELTDLGYETALQDFQVTLAPPAARLHISSSAGRELDATALRGTGQGEAVGPLVYVGLARPEDIPPSGLKGAVALAKRGVIPFGAKAQNAVLAGATALVVFNDEPGIIRGDLNMQSPIPAVAISAGDGAALVKEIDLGQVSAVVTVQSAAQGSRNVVAVTGRGKGPVLVIGGHYDSVLENIGANDNASGTSVVLEMAAALAGMDLPFEVRVILFGSEELGLLGSEHYVASLSREEVGRIVAMLNFDALGAGTLTAGGDEALTTLARRVAQDAGVPLPLSSEPANSASDHAPFREAGVSVMFIFGSDLSAIHTPRDTMANLDEELLGQAVEVGLGVVRALAAQ